MNSNPSQSIQKIVIVGGGSAGWMTAASLSNVLKGKCDITLIESDEIGIVGVGEATIPPIRVFNQTLGISEAEFLQRTNGTFKLGIEFVNWGSNGSRYFHPFGTYGRQFDTVSMHHYWLSAHQQGQAKPLDEYAMAWHLARKGKFIHPSGDPKNVLSTFEYAYHFDAGLYVKFLRDYAEQRGVKRIEGKISHASKNKDTGFISSVSLENGQVIDGEFFIDCSGFRGLLIEQALHTGYETWSEWLPCDRAWAVPTASNADPIPYTRSTAHTAGWQWRIPLQNRVGNGHVFSSAFISEEHARQQLLDNLDSDTLAEPRLIKFVTGRRKRFWNKNVVAIGLASGFIEPLESTSIHLIQAGIAKLLALFPDKSFNQRSIDEYNRIAIAEVERIRDFIILHYKLMERRDTEMWRYCADMDVPDELAEKIAHFREFGRITKGEMDLFGNTSWLAVHIGQGNTPQRTDPLVHYSDADYTGWLNKLNQVMTQYAQQAPGHMAYINNMTKS
ncbi:tryptophan halogenase family protein [Alteromonas lipolytica]|uniref:Tryptophan halogenase n=1 Tax=Alteromonas lipolytica TaxID=1856405 RepID=A0A1E8FDI6_9ALTE|nr:tryptophan halogenase family protein [Alteromonas lipolytica]OFI33981.1 tryptophan halogenase [Alteromonas lipolytica]GGF66665.1 tryptophan halogenase [Alteromonas lipolytica]